MRNRLVAVLQELAAVLGMAFARRIVRQPVLGACAVPAVEDAGNIHAVWTRHAVLAEVAGDRVVLKHELRRLFESIELLLRKRLERRERRYVLHQLLLVGHAAQDRQHLRIRAAEAKRPRRYRSLGIHPLQLGRDGVIELSEPAAQKRLHYDRRDVPRRKRLVEILRVEVSVVHRLRVKPVDIIHLNLAEIPMVLVVMLDAPLERLRVAVEREAEVADASGGAFLQKPIYRPVLDVALGERLESAVADGVEKIEVDVVGPECLERVLKHRLAFLDRILLRREVGELRRDKVAAARMARQRLAHHALGLAATVGGGRVEVVYAMFQREIYMLVHGLLVDCGGRYALGPGVGVLAVFRRQTHRAVAQERNPVPLQVFARGHLTARVKLLRKVGEELASRHLLFPHISPFEVSSCTLASANEIPFVRANAARSSASHFARRTPYPLAILRLTVEPSGSATVSILRSSV